MFTEFHFCFVNDMSKMWTAAHRRYPHLYAIVEYNIRLCNYYKPASLSQLIFISVLYVEKKSLHSPHYEQWSKKNAMLPMGVNPETYGIVSQFSTN